MHTLTTLRRFIVLPAILAAASCATPATAAPLPKNLHAFLAKHCVSCHGMEKQESDLRLDVAEVAFRSAEDFTRWETVLERLEAGEMPPGDRPRPARSEAAAATRTIRGLIERAHDEAGEALRRQPRRLNRLEYQTTVNELLGIDLPLVNSLPEDSLEQGFDKVGRSLNVSSVLVERYMEAADLALREALVTKPKVPENHLHFTMWDCGRARRTLVKNGVWAERDDSVLIWHTNDKWFPLEPFEAPVRGKYRIRIQAYGTLFGKDAKRSEAPVVMTLHGGYFRPEGRTAHLVGFYDIPWESPTVVEATDVLDAGHTFKITIAGQPPKSFNVLEHSGPALAVQWIEIEGPLDEGAAERRRELLFGSVDPATATRADADRLLDRFAERAFRRPTTSADVAPYRAVMHAQFDAGASFLDALHVGMKTILCSPEFLFLDRRPQGPDDYDIAARLSYFFRNAPPDAELLAAAAAGKLQDAGERRRQTQRMLADPRSQAFAEHFLDGWLDLRNIDFTTPDKDIYPSFDESLRDAMLRESRMFFDEMLRRDLSVANVVDSDFSLLNERLARHYGIAGVRGTEMRKVSLPADTVRGGMLTQAAVLKVTADGTVTSPVLRGVWLLDKIMGTPPPPPPPSVPGLEPDIRGATTIRQLLAKHRTLSSCASCHKKIDPPGFALENFDPIGAWRTNYRVMSDEKTPDIKGELRPRYVNGPKVESSDELPDGRRFADVNEFKQLLLADMDGLAKNVAAKLLTYALGREPDYVDRAELQRVVDRVHEKNYGLRSLIEELVASDAFVRP